MDLELVNRRGNRTSIIINKRRLGRRKELVFVDEVGGLTGMSAAINVEMGLDVINRWL